MIKQFCDNCSKESTDLQELTEQGFNILYVCGDCLSLINLELKRVQDSFDKARSKVVSRYFEKINKIKKEDVPQMYEWVQDGGALRSKMTEEYIKFKKGNPIGVIE